MASAAAAALGWGVPQLYAKGETPRVGRILDPTKGRGSLRHVAPAQALLQQAAPSPLTLALALARTPALALALALAPTPTPTLSQAAPPPSPRSAAYSQRREELAHVPAAVAAPPSTRPESVGAHLSQ